MKPGVGRAGVVTGYDMSGRQRGTFEGIAGQGGTGTKNVPSDIRSRSGRSDISGLLRTERAIQPTLNSSGTCKQIPSGPRAASDRPRPPHFLSGDDPAGKECELDQEHFLEANRRPNKPIHRTSPGFPRIRSLLPPPEDDGFTPASRSSPASTEVNTGFPDRDDPAASTLTLKRPSY